MGLLLVCFMLTLHKVMYTWDHNAPYHQHMLTHNLRMTVLQQSDSDVIDAMSSLHGQAALLMHFCPCMILMHAE